MSDFTVFHCDPWESYIRQPCADSDRELRQWELEQDLEREHELRAEFFEDLEADETSVDDWSWYADAPYEVQLPEVFEP